MAERIFGPLAKPIASEMLLDQGKFGGKNASGPSPEIMGLKAVRMALNQDMCSGDTALKAGDEVAFFPPVTGG